jgi:hypothetical protein
MMNDATATIWGSSFWKFSFSMLLLSGGKIPKDYQFFAVIEAGAQLFSVLILIF